MAIVGGSEDDSGKGAAWVFTRNGDVWSQEGRKLVGSGAAGNASQGWSVSVSTGGRTVVLGGYGDSLEVGAAWVFVRIISVVDDQEDRSPQPFDCVGNYPNPFNGSTTITYRLSSASAVRLTVYDLLGREMSVLVNERRDAGIHDARFEGSGLASGVYMYRVTAEGVTQTRKLILLR
ncbi:T9SS type A sorting domain-containing protein [bacterium]|nr:T9SS type A sorting domain-containing protein [bacterium]